MPEMPMCPMHPTVRLREFTMTLNEPGKYVHADGSWHLDFTAETTIGAGATYSVAGLNHAGLPTLAEAQALIDVEYERNLRDPFQTWPIAVQSPGRDHD